MKAIMISIKPQWCAEIMNGNKTIELRKNKALANAIQNLIDECGYAEIHGYCSKDNKKHLYPVALLDKHNKVFKRGYKEDDIDNRTNYLNGKVPFKFRCYKVEEIDVRLGHPEIYIGACIDDLWCLDNGYHDKNYMANAIHISDLEIFDEPKELSEFMVISKKTLPPKNRYILTKAPQNFCFVEVE